MGETWKAGPEPQGEPDSLAAANVPSARQLCPPSWATWLDMVLWKHLLCPEQHPVDGGHERAVGRGCPWHRLQLSTHVPDGAGPLRGHCLYLCHRCDRMVNKREIIVKYFDDVSHSARMYSDSKFHHLCLLQVCRWTGSCSHKLNRVSLACVLLVM